MKQRRGLMILKAMLRISYACYQFSITCHVMQHLGHDEDDDDYDDDDDTSSAQRLKASTICATNVVLHYNNKQHSNKSKIKVG
jgi:hypothetical protein